MSAPPFNNNSEFAIRCREKATLVGQLKGLEGPGQDDRRRELEAILSGRLAEYPALSLSSLRMLERPGGDELVKAKTGYRG